MSADHTPSAPPSVFVLEDDAIWKRIIRHTFAKQNVRVAETSSVEEAIEHLREQAYDLVLLDYELPDGCGLDVLDAVDRVQLGRVVLASGSVDGHDLGDARCEAVDRFLTKPFLSSDLIACLEGVSGASRPAEVG